MFSYLFILRINIICYYFVSGERNDDGKIYQIS